MRPRCRLSTLDRVRIPRPCRTQRWSLPSCQAILQLPRFRRQVWLSLASGFEVAELELMQSSPVLAVTAPWPGPVQAEQPIRWYAGAAGEVGHGELSASHRAMLGASVWTRYLHQMATRYRAVFFSPRFDPLPPSWEVQAALAHLVRQCARLGVQSWLQTRGVILPVLREALCEFRTMVRVSVAITTLDGQLTRALEPGSAPPALRIRQLAWLLAEGISTHVTLAPLVPDLTDTFDNLLPVLSALEDLGLTRATFGYLLVDPLVQWSHPSLAPAWWWQPLAQIYEAGTLRRYGVNTWARTLTLRERQRRYARLLAWATELGFELRPSTLADPDFRRHASADELQPSLWCSG
ncbi:MAG: hypothetical protein RMI91_10495 [Gemmatales bacterium]|nr:hypothetical protein [Gemmatales bacterium]MDW7995071.1 hypothetical protein [Gemmatales bacterium]